MNTAKKLGFLVHKQRKEKNLTTTELAKLLNVSVGYVNNIENNKTDTFKLDLLFKLLNELDISLSDLFSDNAEIIKAVDMRDDFIKVSFSVEKMDNLQLIKDNITNIINSYISTLSKYTFDADSIETISQHLLSQLKYTDELYILSQDSN